MHADHGIPVFDVHLVKDLIAQEPGVVHYRIDATERGQRRLDDRARTAPFGNTGRVGHRLAATGTDLVDDCMRRRRIITRAVGRSTKIVDDHSRALGSALQRDGATDAPAGSGHDHHLAFQHAHAAASIARRRCAALFLRSIVISPDL